MQYLINIYHDDDKNFAEWFKNGLLNIKEVDDLLFTVKKIPNPDSIDFLTLPEKIKQMLRLDKPDIIATVTINEIEIPFFAIEHTISAPLGDHIQQRIPRVIAAAENNVPIFYFVLSEKTNSNGDIYKLENYNFHITDKISKINKTPAILLDYLKEDTKYPNCPSLSEPEISNYFKIILEVMKTIILKKDINILPSILKLISDQWHKTGGDGTLLKFYNNIIKKGKTLEEIKTLELFDYLKNKTLLSKRQIEEIVENLPQRLKSRKDTIIIYATRLIEHSGDPYTGKLASYDYLFCRNDKNVEKRTKNLILVGRDPKTKKIAEIEREFSKTYNDYYLKKDPFKIKKPKNIKESLRIAHALQYGSVYTKQRPLRIYGYFSDMIIFRDAVLMF